MATVVREEVERRTQKVIAEQLCVEKDVVTLNKHVNDDLGADSLDEVEIAMALEDEFEISIPDADIEALRTVQQIVDYVWDRLQ